MSMFNLTTYLSRSWPEQIFIETASERLTGQVMLSEVSRICNWLEQLGLQAGDYCGIQGLNQKDTLLLILACFCRGVIAVPLNPKFQSVHLKPYLQQIPKAVVIKEAGWYQLDSRQDHIAKDLVIDGQRPALVIFTSGSSGQAKGVLHNWSSLQASAESSLKFYDFHAGDSWLLSLGLFHVGGLMIAIRTLLGRGTLLIPDETQDLAANILQRPVQWLSLVPTQLDDLLAKQELVAVLGSCRGLILGGAAASEACLSNAFDLNLPISLSYGSSETAAQLTASPVRYRPQNLSIATAGFPLPGRELKIREEDQLILCRGPGLFQGYWIDRKFYPHPAGSWFPSSDRGQWTADGLEILGRQDDVFKCGGEGLSRSEIQREIDKFSADWQAVICKQPDKRLGWIPVMYMESAEKPDLSHFLNFMKQSLPSVKQPRRIYWRTPALLNASQKAPIAVIEEQLKLKIAIASEQPQIYLLWQR